MKTHIITPEWRAYMAANRRANRAYYADDAPSPPRPPRDCPECSRPHTGSSHTCGACRMRRYRQAKKDAA